MALTIGTKWVKTGGVITLIANRDTIAFEDNNINFNIKRGEILGLIGESGSGKSMLGCALLEMVPVGCLITKGSIVTFLAIFAPGCT